MKEKQFLTKHPKQAVPPPIHIDHRKIPVDTTPAMNKALKDLSVSVETTRPAIEPFLTKTKSLPEDYKARVEREATFFRRYVTGTSTERPEEINFILSVASSIDPAFSTPLSLRNLTTQKKRLDEMPRITPLIIDGAYLLVQHEIHTSYQSAWFRKDPHSSQLYVELTERLGEKSNEEKIACLMALQTHLQAKSIQEKVNFGSKGVEKILAQLTDQLASLASPSPAKTM